MRKNIFIRIVSLACILALLLSTTVPSVFASGASYFPAYSGSSGSLVEGLNTIGVESSFAFRKEIAKANNIVGYRGTAEQNTALLQKLQEGILIDPNAASVVSFTGDFGGIEHGITVIKDRAPLRTAPDGDAAIKYRAEKGSVLELLGVKRTGFFGFRKWYVVSYNGSQYYLFSDNAEVHSHSYVSYSVAGTPFKVCDCGHVVFTTYQSVEIKRAESYAAIGTAAATAVFVDGPIPIGDIIGAVIVAAGTVYWLTGDVISSDTAQTIATDVDYVDYLKTVKNECSGSTYRMVARAPENLRFISDSCLNIGEAYVYAAYCGGDVWCSNRIVAKALADLHGTGCYSEVDRNQPTHYQHFHLGGKPSIKVGGHVFYGTNELGQTPTY